MSTTTKLKLKLIDENSVISTADLNENYGIMETALDTTLDKVTPGTIIDYNTINNNFQTIDDEWIDTSVANATNADILSGKTAFVNKVKLTGTMTNHGAVTAAINAGGSYTIPAGYHNGSGKVSVAYATQATPSISVNTSTGLITASATQTAGFVNAGTKNATSQLTVQAAKTITPSTTNQTAVASGRYTTGAIKVLGDADLKASNIKSGVNIFGVKGTYAGADPAITTVSSISYNSSNDTIRIYIPGITATSQLLNISVMFNFYSSGTQIGYVNGVVYHSTNGQQYVYTGSDLTWQHLDWGALWAFTIANGYIEFAAWAITAGSTASNFIVEESGVAYI